jgi:type II secretory pathway component PulL
MQIGKTVEEIFRQSKTCKEFTARFFPSNPRHSRKVWMMLKSIEKKRPENDNLSIGNVYNMVLLEYRCDR